MTPKAAHNAVAAVVEMYAEALTEMHTRETALISEIGKLRSENQRLNERIKEFLPKDKVEKEDVGE